MSATRAFQFCGTAVALMLSVQTAYARPDTRAMSCQQTRNLIERNGAIVLSTGTYTYDRYVSPRGYFCASNEVPNLVAVPTRDTPDCTVYRCEPFEPLFNFEDR